MKGVDIYGRSPLWHTMKSGDEIITKMLLVTCGGMKASLESRREVQLELVLLVKLSHRLENCLFFPI